ncbi:caspase family protein [Promethearchaeum syntrophicum]|uniref:Caspase family protein n=1 Tax=Promethearchaeum syntrophicum TaxID=2594042 RepID=A0A5B9DBQ7_9ARCH|nr:caspase family protein [Candidatus Prometheoarchaeum syntrophicum]QEE16699.1 Caspase domain protein [Candidatus Prometheoarchaeum syntrophicum]
MSKTKVSVREIVLISILALNFISPFLFIQSNLTISEKLKGNNLFEGEVKSSSIEDPREGYAIICGVSDYPGSINDLSYCDDDAEEIYNFILDNYHIPDSNIVKLIDSEVTIPDISYAISNFSDVMNENDVLFFSYSGHGSQEISSIQYSWNVASNHPYSNNMDDYWHYSHPGAELMRVHFTKIELEDEIDEIYIGDNDDRWPAYVLYDNDYTDLWSGWIPCDDIYVNLYTDYSITEWGFEIDLVEVGYWEDSYCINTHDGLDSGLNGSTLNSYFNEVPGQVVTLLDSCHSGGVARDFAQTDRYVISASNSSEYSLEDPYRENGVFSYSFLNSWDNNSDINNDGVISYEENFEAIYNSTVDRSTYLGFTHHPEEYDGIDGELILEPNGKINSVIPSGNDQVQIEFALSGLGVGKLILVYYDFTEQTIVRSEIEENIQNSAGWQQKLFASSLTGHDISGITFKAIQTNNGFSEIDNESIELTPLGLSYSGDFDGDSLSDAYEFEIGFNLWDSDWDNDELSDDIELQIGTDSLSLDTDYDGMPDGWEYFKGTNPLVDDATDDPDGDGLINSEEFSYGTDPLDMDTDDDQYTDKEEIDRNTNPLKSISNPMMRGISITLGVIGFLSISAIIWRKKFYKPKPRVPIRDSPSSFQIYGTNPSIGTFGSDNSPPETSSSSNSFIFDEFDNFSNQKAKFKFCTNCGAPITDGKSLFCTECGNRLI